MFVPKKNITEVLRDVSPPAGSRLRKPPQNTPQARFSMVSARKVPIGRGLYPQRSFFKKFSISFLIVLTGVMAFYAVQVYRFKNEATASFNKIQEHLATSAGALLALHPEEAERGLRTAQQEFADIKDAGGRYGLWDLGKVIGSVWSPIQEAVSLLPNVEDIFAASLRVTDRLAFLKANAPELFFEGNGEKLISALQDMSADLKILDSGSEDIVNKAHSLSSLTRAPDPGNYLALKVRMYDTAEFLDSLRTLLVKNSDAHILLLFENPSEMRPTGGFIGSYAVLTVHQGALRDVEVRDIYDPDGQLDLKTVPPKPLQAITTNWGARDANWFFDFPTSAQKIIYFLENSKIYKEQGVTFDGALALNANAVASMVGAAGPISLPEYHTVLTEENFLLEIQKEVRSGKGRSEGKPKQILKDVAPLLLAELKNIKSSQVDDLLKRIEEHVRQKDVLAYFKNPILENFMAKAGAAGEIFKIPKDWSGDYLAVVNANIAGGKTDIFMEQQIALKSRIDSEGKTQNELTVTRTHNGANERDSWYRETNQDYLRVYALPDSKLISLQGDTPKKIASPANYKKGGYDVDANVESAETGGGEFGRAVFSAWLNVPAGDAKKLLLTYENSKRVTLAEGQVYQFVFDRQAGVHGGLDYEIEAPPGFKWAEASSVTFAYHNENPEGRVVINLTLKKI